MKILKKKDFEIIGNCIIELQFIYFKEWNDRNMQLTYFKESNNHDIYKAFYKNLIDLAYELDGDRLADDVQKCVWLAPRYAMVYKSTPRTKILTNRKVRRIQFICLDLIKQILVLKYEPLEHSLELYSQIANYFDLPRVKNIGYNGKE